MDRMRVLREQRNWGEGTTGPRGDFRFDTRGFRTDIERGVVGEMGPFLATALDVPLMARERHSC